MLVPQESKLKMTLYSLFSHKILGSSGKSTQNYIIYTFSDKNMLVSQKSQLKMTLYSLFSHKILGSSGKSNQNNTI